MKILRQYIGILRLYSLVDYILLLLALQFSLRNLLGAVLLWIGFLFLLEVQHKHDYRLTIPLILVYFFIGMGLVVFSNFLGGIIFLILGYIYSLKNSKYWGIVSPLIRALQPIAIIGSVSQTPHLWLTGALTFIRNLLGDIRDIAKDRKEGLRTIPVMLGLSRGNRNVHLIGILVTSFIWWKIGQFSLVVLILVWTIEVLTYNLTPRSLD